MTIEMDAVMSAHGANSSHDRTGESGVLRQKRRMGQPVDR
jgi:hypothetical protein